MKNVGSVVGLYPTPDTVVGTVQNGRVNWMNVAHVGVWGFDCMMLSIGKPHYTAKALHGAGEGRPAGKSAGIRG